MEKRCSHSTYIVHCYEDIYFCGDCFTTFFKSRTDYCNHGMDNKVIVDSGWKCKVCGVVTANMDEDRYDEKLDMCCDQPLVYSNGYYVCFECSLAKDYNHFVLEYDDLNDTIDEYTGKREGKGYTISKKRYYQKSYHFNNTFKNYVNPSLNQTSEKVLKKLAEQVDMQDRMAYLEIRECLRKWKLGRLYKEIFGIIYRCGGVKPTIKNYDKIFQEIKNIENYMRDISRRENRKKSMPSTQMLLYKVLQMHDCEPYYYFFTIKDLERSKQVDIFFQQYYKDVVENRGGI